MTFKSHPSLNKIFNCYFEKQSKLQGLTEALVVECLLRFFFLLKCCKRHIITVSEPQKVLKVPSVSKCALDTQNQ